jgi:2-polyprenyl-6-methoxyphenol hydroxylase-like FAD-dependent oxidoreductase
VLKYVTDKYHEDRPPLRALFGNYKVTGDDLLHQLNLAHSAYTVTTTEEDKRSFFAAIDHMDPDGKTAHCFWSLYWEDLHPVEPYWTQSATAQELLEFVQKQTASFAPSLRLPVEKTTVDGIVLPPLAFHEVELHGSDLKPGRITCIGDAAHSMMPSKSAHITTHIHAHNYLPAALLK